jgi:site-specific recombinase XerD
MNKRNDPQRRGLRFPEWPQTDRTAWENAVSTGNVFDGRGRAAHWAPTTKKTNIVNYGRWLGFLKNSGLLDAEGSPEGRVTPDVVAKYLEFLRPLMAPRSVLALLVGLKVTVMAMAPAVEWRWLKDLCNVLNRNSPPSVDKQARLHSAQEIYVAANKQLEQLRKIPLESRNMICAYRDTLMIGFMAARPLRRHNLAGLRIGVHMTKLRGIWHIEVPHYETKNRKLPLEFDLPPELVPYLNFYIEKVRPRMLRDLQPDALWLAWGGQPMTESAIYHCLSRRTQELLGTKINPHLFRDCAASSLALESPEFARAAAPLLGHTSFATTERYYVQARQIDASRKLNDALTKIKAGLKG